jgi:hypothetical protein
VRAYADQRKISEETPMRYDFMPTGEAAFWLIDGPDTAVDVDFDPSFTFLIMSAGFRPAEIAPPCRQPGKYQVVGRAFDGAEYPMLIVQVAEAHAKYFTKMPQAILDRVIIEVASMMMGEVQGHA